MSKGFYQLILYLDRDYYLRIGKKGKYIFPEGYYIYTGSALDGLEKRIERHLQKKKRKFWHIDYLLPFCQIQKIISYNLKGKTECVLNRDLLNKKDAKVVMKGFGSSDCRCPAHLVFFESVRTGLKPAPYGHES